MKKITLLIIIAVISFYIFNKETTIDLFMEVEFPIVASEESGIKEFSPKRGSIVEMTDLIEPGLLNIIHMYRANCGACREMDKLLNQLVSIRPDVAITLIPSVGTVGYQARNKGKVLEIQLLPMVIIFDRLGKQVAINDDDGGSEGSDFVYNWLKAEIKRLNKKGLEKYLRNRDPK